MTTQTARLRNAAHALIRARADYRPSVTPHEPAAAGLYAGRILADDDRFGVGSGLVVQGDAVSWRSVDALEVLARRGQRAHREQDRHPPGVTPLTCPLCAAAFALDVHLVDGLAAFRARSR